VAVQIIPSQTSQYLQLGIGVGASAAERAYALWLQEKARASQEALEQQRLSLTSANIAEDNARQKTALDATIAHQKWTETHGDAQQQRINDYEQQRIDLEKQNQDRQQKNFETTTQRQAASDAGLQQYRQAHLDLTAQKVNVAEAAKADAQAKLAQYVNQTGDPEAVAYFNATGKLHPKLTRAAGASGHTDDRWQLAAIESQLTDAHFNFHNAIQWRDHVIGDPRKRKDPTQVQAASAAVDQWTKTIRDLEAAKTQLFAKPAAGAGPGASPAAPSSAIPGAAPVAAPPRGSVPSADEVVAPQVQVPQMPVPDFSAAPDPQAAVAAWNAHWATRPPVQTVQTQDAAALGPPAPAPPAPAGQQGYMQMVTPAEAAASLGVDGANPSDPLQRGTPGVTQVQVGSRLVPMDTEQVRQVVQRLLAANPNLSDAEVQAYLAQWVMGKITLGPPAPVRPRQ
jgi:hypothetical protein